MALTERISADLPVALNADLTVNMDQTLALAQHVRRGGIATLFLAGNANLQSMSLGQFEAVVQIAQEASAGGPVTIGLGPELGRMLDQASILGRSTLHSVVVLPIISPADTHGTADGIRHIAERIGHGVMVDLVRGNHLRPVTLRKLVDEGAITAVRYANPISNPGDDYYLDSVIDIMGPSRVLSGAGEVAFYDHLYVRGIVSASSGIAALAPRLLRRIVEVMPGDPAAAQRMLAPVLEMSRIRAMLGPIQVLHDAVSEAAIARMGPQMPMISSVKDKFRLPFVEAVKTVMAAEAAL